jgi:hypothetical protein
MNNDVKAKRNKAAFVGSVIVIAVLAVASFAMLGFEQHEFLVFDADRTQARREEDRLHSKKSSILSALPSLRWEAFLDGRA